MSAKTAVLLNPHSRHGESGRLWKSMAPQVREAVGEYDLLETQRPGHATDLVRKALRSGCSRVVCVGGDGTLHEAVNGFFDKGSPVAPDVPLGLIPLGTGCDFARSVDIPKGAAAIRALATDNVRTIDVGTITTHDDSGGEVSQIFLNASHSGLGGRVARIANNSSKRLGGFLTFLGAVIEARLTTKAVRMMVEVDGTRYEESLLDVIVTNGQFDGGGIHMAPRAKLDDGLLDIFLLGDFTYLETATNLRRLYSGRADEHPKVTYVQGKKISIRPENPVPVSPDGESGGYSPVEIEILPAALRVVTGPNPLAV